MDISSPENRLQNMDYSNAKTLQSIQELQQLEKQLYTNLEKSSANPSDNNLVEQEQVIKRINELSNTRIQLFNSLRNVYQDSQQNVNKLRSELADKMIVSKVMEEQLNGLKSNMNAIKDDKNNKLRMVEINTYFGKRYQAHTGIMKNIIAVCLALLLINVLTKRGRISLNISNVLIKIILIVGGFYIIRQGSDLLRRDNMNYDEYDWNKGFQPKGQTIFEYNKQHLGGLFDDTKDKLSSSTNIDGWNICGEGTVYDTSKNQCIIKLPEMLPNQNNGQVKENFFTMDLSNIQGYNPSDNYFEKV